jgi:predicted HD phosphohydrolase
MTHPGGTVHFRHLKEATTEDWQLLRRHEEAFARGLPDRLLAALKALDDDTITGYRISRLAHCLQTATRAERDSADDEMVIAALLHDIGDTLAPTNHAEFAAAILRPYVRAEVAWTVEVHGLFQMQFYGQHFGLPTDAHLVWRDHPGFDTAQRFVEHWDQAAFDDMYPTLPLEHFEARLRAIFTREPKIPQPPASKNQTLRISPA